MPFKYVSNTANVIKGYIESPLTKHNEMVCNIWLLFQNESMSDHDLVSIGPDGAAPSIHSEWTELDKLDKPDPVREKVLGWIAEVPSDQHSRDADAEMDHMEGSVSHFDSPRDSSRSEILVDVHENKSSKHEDNTAVESPNR